MKTQKIQDMIHIARELREGATANYRQFQDRYSAGKSRIHNVFKGANPQAENVYKGRQRRELMHMLKEERNAYREILTTAAKQAEELIHASIKAPPQDLVDRFEVKLASIKTEVMLRSPEAGAKLVQELVETTSEPYLAGRVRDSFADLVGSILTGAGVQAARYKIELSGMFDAVKESALTDEAREASQLLATAEGLLDAGIYHPSSPVVAAVKEHFGRRASEFVGNPDGFFSSPDFVADAQLQPGELSDEERSLEAALRFAGK